MDKIEKNKIVPSSLDDVKGMLEPKSKNPDTVPKDEDPDNPVEEQLGGSLKTTISKKLKPLQLNFSNIKYV